MKNTLVKTEIKKDTKNVSKLELLKAAVNEARNNYDKKLQELNNLASPYLKTEFNTMVKTLTKSGFSKLKPCCNQHVMYSNGVYLVKLNKNRPSAYVFMLDDTTPVKDLSNSNRHVASFGNYCGTIEQVAKDSTKAFCAFIYAVTD